MGKKKNYKVKGSAGKKYTGNTNQKVVSRQKKDRPKSQLLDEPIKDEAKTVEPTTEVKEPNRIEELKSQIEKLQAEKQVYYEGAEKGESEIVAAERKDTNSINRTKIDVEIYRLQKELRDLLSKENENTKNQEVKDNKPEEKKPEKIESPEVKALKSQISDLDNKISSEEWVLRNNEGNYLPEELEQIKAGIENLKAQRDEVSGKLNDLQNSKEPEKNLEDNKEDQVKGNDKKDEVAQETSKKDDEKDNSDSKQDSPEVKALKDKIKVLEEKINSENSVLMNNNGNYLENDIKEIKDRLGELKAEHAELIGKLNDLEKGLKGVETKEKSEDDKNKPEGEKDSENKQSENKDKSDDKEKNKDKVENDKSKNPEMLTYKVGPFKRLLMNIIRKIKSWAKADGRIARLCDKAEGALVSNATPLLEDPTNEKNVKEVLKAGKEKDANAEYSKDKFEQADDHVEAKKKLDLADMEFIEKVVMKSWENKEKNLMTEVFNKQYEEGFKEEKGINEEKLKKFIEENNIPSATKKDRINAALWCTSQKIIEMAKEKGIPVNEGKGKKSNARPLSEIYPSLEARIKTDRVSREAKKKSENESGENKETKSKTTDDLDK